MSEVKRVFIAINIPDKIRQEIFAACGKALDAKRWKVVPPENLHLTLHFLGYLGEAKIREVQEALKALHGVKNFDLELKGIGSFGNRVLWLGVGDGGDKVKEITERLQEALGTWEGRFHAHVTLARNRSMGSQAFKACVQELGKKEMAWRYRVMGVDLMESKLSPHGSSYSPLSRHPLA